MHARAFLRHCALVAGVCTAGLLAFGAATAAAATFTATSTKTLQTAINSANAATGDSTIQLAGGVTYLPTATLAFTNTTGTITVEGPAATTSTSANEATLSGSSVQPFPSDFIDVDAGADVVFQNVAITGGGGAGGFPAINDMGTVAVNSSAVEGNAGFGLFVQTGSSATAEDSTFGDGLQYGIVDDGTLSLTNSTVAFNQGGIDNANGTALNLTNSIVAENTGGSDCTAAATTVDDSLDSDGSCGVSAALSGVDPNIVNKFSAPVLDGGTTPTYPLMPGSPAIGKGDESKCPTTDQRGFATNDPCDLGAEAYSTAKPVVDVPSNITTPETDSTGATVSYTVTATDAGGAIASIDCTPASGSLFAPGTTTVNCTATDYRGNTGSGSFTVDVTSGVVTPPTLSLPSDITTPATGASGAVVTYTATATAASGTTLNADQPVCTPASGSTFPVGTTTVDCTATDADTGMASGSFTVTVTDVPPVISNVPADITAAATSSSGAVVTYSSPTATDVVDGTDPVTCSPASGSTFPVGTTTVTCTAVDTAGESATPATFTVTVNASTVTPPTLSLPSDITTPATGPSGAPVAYTVTATQAAGTTLDAGSPACTPAPGSTFPVGTTTVNCTATDADGGTASGSFTVTVTDVPPVISNVPADITAAATSSSGAVVTYSSPTATDVVDGTDPVTCSPASGSTFPVGTTTVTCTAVDAAGESATPATFTVTVNASTVTPPTLSLPSDITTPATGASGAVVTYTATATAASGTTLNADQPVCTPASGSTFPVGTTTVDCTATDADTGMASGSFTVTVTDVPPVISNVPADITAAATSSSGAVVTYSSPTATDVVDGTDPVTCSPASGSTFPVGTTTVTCTAVDTAGESATPATFTVTVNASTVTPPTLSLPSDITTPATGSSGATVTYTATATAASGTTLNADQPVCTPASGSAFPVGTTTVNCTATDADGGTASGSFTVTVTDVPTIVGVPSDITVTATSSTGAVVTYTNPTATDPVDGTSDVVTCSPASGSTFPVGTTTVTCTTTNVAGNSATPATFTVTVNAQTSPGGTPQDQIWGLIGSVNVAGLPTGLTDLLDGLLWHALGGLGPFGVTASSAANATLESQAIASGGFGGPAGRWSCQQHAGYYGDTCSSLAEFAFVVELGEHSGAIPAAIASQWLATVNSLESELGCYDVSWFDHDRRDHPNCWRQW